MTLQGNGSMGATMKSFRLFKKDLDKDTLFYPSKLTTTSLEEGSRIKTEIQLTTLTNPLRNWATTSIVPCFVTD